MQSFIRYNFGGSTLKQKPCDRAGRRRATNPASQTVPWTTSELMQYSCVNLCGSYPAFKPDDPKNHQYCSLCSPKFNAPIEVDFWVAKGSVKHKMKMAQRRVLRPAPWVPGVPTVPTKNTSRNPA